MQTKLQWHVKAYHLFMIYLPVLVLCSLILIIYFSYIFTYVLVLMNSKQVPQDNFAFSHTSKPTYAQEKGILLLTISSVSIFMLIISLLRTVFMNPGYMPSPTEIESKLVIRFTNENKSYYSEEHDALLERKYFVKKFDEIISETPMTSNEGINLRNEINKFLNKERLVNHSNDVTVDVKEDLNHKSDLINYKELSKMNLCATCLRLKIERSHHCRLCGKCVLKMDHHCPWLANCIGFRNYKYFLLTHFYGLISTMIVAFTYWEVIINANLNHFTETFIISYTIFIYVMNLGLFSFLFYLFWINWKLAFLGLTVIENADRERFPSIKSENIYNLGYYKNFQKVFGKNPLTWFLPICANYEGEGIFYEKHIQ
jgi:hypothetical protein